ncbi:MAG TPA: hypothetical protein VIX61_01270, partial [Casimicrobiaceae bacterium]
MIGNTCVARRNFALPLGEHSLECRKGGVVHGAVRPHQGDEIAHPRRVEIQRAGVLRNQVEARERAGIVVGLDEEVEHQLVDMRQLVVAVHDRLLGTHERRHVPGDAHVAGMRVGRDFLDPFRLEGVVDLDLAVAALGIPVNCISGLLQAVDEDAVARRVWTLALDETERHDARTHCFACLDLSHEVGQCGIVVTHVAHRRHTAGNLQQRAPFVLVTVHVDQGRHQHASLGVDLRRGGARLRTCLVDRGNVTTIDIDVVLSREQPG